LRPPTDEFSGSAEAAHFSILCRILIPFENGKLAQEGRAFAPKRNLGEFSGFRAEIPLVGARLRHCNGQRAAKSLHDREVGFA
jgi:hypothetical protein